MPAHSLLQWQERGQLHRLWKRQRLPCARTLLNRVTGGATLSLSPSPFHQCEDVSCHKAGCSPGLMVILPHQKFQQLALSVVRKRAACNRLGQLKG